MDQNLYVSVMNQLQKRIKAEKISRTQLARLTKVPVSTLKKWFLSQDGAMSRLHTLCAALEISLSEILKSIEDQSVRTIKMGEKQQSFFSADFRAFELYWLFVYERRPLDWIQERLGLTDAEMKKRLLRLDRLQLIKVSAGGKAESPKVTPVRWSSEGPFMRRIFETWTHDLVLQAMDGKNHDRLALQYFQISKESHEELRRDLVALEEKYARRTIQELRIKGLALQKVRTLLATAEGEFLSPSTGRIK